MWWRIWIRIGGEYVVVVYGNSDDDDAVVIYGSGDVTKQEIIVIKSSKLVVRRCNLLEGIMSSMSYDEDINTIVTPTAPAAIHTGPITRARARQLN